MRIALALPVSALFPSTVMADTADMALPFAVLGIGSAPCFGVTEALNKIVSSADSDSHAVLSSSQELISDYSAVSAGVYDITAGVNIDALQQRVLDFGQDIPKLLCSALSTHFCPRLPAGQPSQHSIS